MMHIGKNFFDNVFNAVMDVKGVNFEMVILAKKGAGGGRG